MNTAEIQFIRGDERRRSEHVTPILPLRETAKKGQVCQIWKRQKKFWATERKPTPAGVAVICRRLSRESGDIAG
jgi:hypothetical protein